MIRGAIFDADGTLLDSMGMWEDMATRYLLSLGKTPRPDLREAIFHLSQAECADYLQRVYRVERTHDEIEDDIRDMIRGFYRHEVTAKAGAADFLRGLRDRGVKLALATATDRSVILEGLAHVGLLPLLDVVLTCGDLGVNKSTPAIYDAARDALGTRTEETWVFEDAVHAATTARRAGYPVAGVYDPFSDQEALKAVSTLYLPDLTDLPGFWAAAGGR